MNEFPRLRYLWLERFPFSATFSARVEGSTRDQYLPIFGIGHVAVALNDQRLFEFSNYQREFLSLVPLEPGSQILRVDYEYRDDATSEPESAPEPRGPYARLKIGKPMSKEEALASSRVRITSATSLQVQDLTSSFVVTDREGKAVEVSDVTTQSSNGQSEPKVGELVIEFSAEALKAAPLTLSFRQSDRHTNLATITVDESRGLSIVMKNSDAVSQLEELSGLLWIDRDSIESLEPGSQAQISIPLRALLAVLDFFSLMIMLGLAFSLVRTLKFGLGLSALLGIFAWIAINPFDSILPPLVGGGRELVIPYALITMLVIMLRRRILRHPLVFLLPLSAVLSAQKIFEHLLYNHPGQGDEWWGKLVFLWRDSDWFANNGNARAIFTEGSLRGGESVYWFRVAPRYLIFVSHMLLGENDVLIALISLAIGFMVIVYLGARFSTERQNRHGVTAGLFVTFVGFIFMGDQLIVAFAFFVSSEYPTWIILLAITAYLVRREPENRVWVFTAMSALLASTVQFRPNGIFVAISLLLVLIVRKTQRGDQTVMIRQVFSGIAAFVVVLLLSLIHNLYYGAEFVLFTPNPTNMYAFDLGEIFGNEGFGGVLTTLWNQTASLLYWRWPNDPSYAIFFWGSQLLLLAALSLRWREKEVIRGGWSVSLLPLTYIVPMLPFTLSSYYPRLLVSASLLCLVSALLIWPAPAERTSDSK
jgi:hypothetical protein